MFKKIALLFGVLSIGIVTLVSGPTGIDEYQAIETEMYQEMWQPFVTVDVSYNDVTVRRGSGVLIEDNEGMGCHVYAITNHHVVYGADSIAEGVANVPNLDGVIITVQLAYKLGEEVPEIHNADVVRTSKSADISLLFVPNVSCNKTLTATLAHNNRATKIGTEVWHVTSAGGEPENIEIIPGHVTRFGRDKYGNITLSSTVPVQPGMSGSPVFVRRWGKYQIIGIVEGHDRENGRPSRIMTVEDLHVLIRG